MSGPIVRKYGFPNFEQIFGAREIQHGVDEPEQVKDTTGLPPDLPHSAEPIDANDPSSSGLIAPSTEFGHTDE